MKFVFDAKVSVQRVCDSNSNLRYYYYINFVLYLYYLSMYYNISGYLFIIKELKFTSCLK